MTIKIQDLPHGWQLTPLGKCKPSGEIDFKAPYRHSWQNEDLDREFIEQEIASGKATGYGLRLGIPSGGTLAIEFRYTGNQSVLPPSKHPDTDGYTWINKWM